MLLLYFHSGRLIIIKIINIFNVNSTNSEQCKLYVNSSDDIDTRFLWKATVCSDCAQEVDNKVIKDSMP